MTTQSVVSPEPLGVSAATSAFERRIIFLIGAVQFVNILDFMIVMPLGPDFARELGVATSHLGYVGGSYTASAAVVGFLGSFFLDRFDRRKALAVSMAGLVVATAMGGLAWSFESLMAARVLAGAFGGPATAVAFSIIADTIPVERRGRATGAVMSAFSFASVLGVPIALELARVGGWHLPFFSVAALGALVVFGTVWALPPLTGHLASRQPVGLAAFTSLLRPQVLQSYLMTAMLMGSGFMLIPNISAFVQNNLGYPRARLGLLYLCGGVVSFFATRGAGKLADKAGSLLTSVLGVSVLSTAIFLAFVWSPPGLSIELMFMLFMAGMSLRNVAYHTLTSKVPNPRERAQFMSMQSCVQHLASASGAFVSSQILSVGPGEALVGMPTLGTATIVLSLLVPLVVWRVETKVRRAA